MLIQWSAGLAKNQFRVFATGSVEETLELHKVRGVYGVEVEATGNPVTNGEILGLTRSAALV